MSWTWRNQSSYDLEASSLPATLPSFWEAIYYIIVSGVLIALWQQLAWQSKITGVNAMGITSCLLLGLQPTLKDRVNNGAKNQG